MEPKNLLIIMSDEHNPKILGCYGHPMVRTPNLDSLAANGTRFAAAYTTSPVCVPARAAFATGRYVHQIGFWDNADPYDGSVPSWHHRLRDGGHHVASIGKLHFRGGDDYGFDEEIIPMHVIDAKGDLMGLVRENLPERGAAWKIANWAGPGETPYSFYDREIASRAQIWLREDAWKHSSKPWVLFVSFVCPHFPLTAPPEFYYQYPLDRIAAPKQYGEHERPAHPFLRDYSGSFVYDRYFDEQKLRKAIAGYYGLCSFLDDNVGQVLRALAESSLSQTTRVLYTSDHGDNLGSRGLWGKSTMYEETAGVPLIMSGADIPEGHVVKTPTSHVDVYPFIMQCVGAEDAGSRGDHPGYSLFDIANGFEPPRTVLSEYHGMGSTTGAFMIRNGHYKYVHYVAYEPQLFDLRQDPEELHDLAGDPAFADIVKECRARLLMICDPEEVDRRAKARQEVLLELNGGREAVIARGDLGFSPPPGVQPVFE